MRKQFILFILLTVFSLSAYSQFAVGAAFKVNTFGPGIEAIISPNKFINFRIGGNYIKTRLVGDIDSWYVKGDYYAKLGCLSLITDINAGRVFHINIGVLYNFNHHEITGKPTHDFTVGKLTISPEEIGEVKIKMDYNNICPYLGIGFGTTMPRVKRVTFTFELGFVYEGSPNVTLEATEMLAPTADDEQNINAIQSNVDTYYMFYPVLNFQVSVRIFNKK